jgi:hypothetical protein
MVCIDFGRCTPLSFSIFIIARGLWPAGFISAPCRREGSALSDAWCTLAMACGKCRLIVAEAAVAIVCGGCLMAEWLAAGRGWACVAILFILVFHALPWLPESRMPTVVVFLLARDGHWCAFCLSQAIIVASHCPCNRLYIRDICCKIGDAEGILRSSIRHGLLPE